MFYQYLINLDIIDDEVASLTLHQYVYKNNISNISLHRKLGFSNNDDISINNVEENNKEVNKKINKKAKKIIFYSLRTTKFLLKYAFKTILNYVLPPIAKEISKVLELKSIYSLPFL